MSVPIAMALEIGLPWWGITAIALGVAASSAVGFVLFRARFLRGILATLVLEGVVIAAVAPVVMGSSNGSVSSMSAGERLTTAEFAQQADANCRALARRLAPLGNPKTLPGIAHMLDVALPEFSVALRKQGSLRPPVAEQGTAGQWMTAMTRYGKSLERVRTAAMSGDAAAVAKANERADAIAADAGRVSRQLGLTYCFQ
jgi:hypothetical protein